VEAETKDQEDLSTQEKKESHMQVDHQKEEAKEEAETKDQEGHSTQEKKESHTLADLQKEEVKEEAETKDQEDHSAQLRKENLTQVDLLIEEVRVEIETTDPKGVSLRGRKGSRFQAILAKEDPQKVGIKVEEDRKVVTAGQVLQEDFRKEKGLMAPKILEIESHPIVSHPAMNRERKASQKESQAEKE